MTKKIVLNKITKNVLIVMEFTVSIFVLISLLGISLETIKYRGFIQNHFFIDPLTSFTIGALIFFFLVVFDSPKNYWWKSRLGSLLQKQSKLFLPIILVWWLLLFMLESLNYPNFVFSKYHIDLKSIYILILFESCILLLPKLAVIGKKYLKEISIQLKLKEYVIGLGLIVAALACILIRIWL